MSELKEVSGIDLEFYNLLREQGYNFKYELHSEFPGEGIEIKAIYDGNIIGRAGMERTYISGKSICSYAGIQPSVNEEHRGKRILACMYLIIAILMKSKLRESEISQSPAAESTWKYLRLEYPQFIYN